MVVMVGELGAAPRNKVTRLTPLQHINHCTIPKEVFIFVCCELGMVFDL